MSDDDFPAPESGCVITQPDGTLLRRAPVQ